MEKKVKISVFILASILFVYLAYDYSFMKNESDSFVLVSVKQNDKQVYWVTLHRVTEFELYHSELEIRYHYGSISKHEIDFSSNSATMVGYEIIDFMSYAGFSIIDDKMQGYNSTEMIVYNLLSKYRYGGKLTW